MARKRKKLNHLDYETQEYWNGLLNEEGLSIHTGESQKLIYVGGTSDIELIEGVRRTTIGRKAPYPQSGQSSDKE